MKGAPTDGSIILQTPASMLMIYAAHLQETGLRRLTDVTAVTLACTFDFGFCVGPAVRPITDHPELPGVVQGHP